ncbi:unnamed protein product [Cuscuta epithymum]|uniref:NAC domain-containing protein n=1 Tax=Cuscuta epithymum TaxID=186058 RepID=A0AAV0GJD1_9ASTE|nr:unnamed protein product [Cuscuta epithymum]CAH9148070.1 unnamed protein product [Cuscuta epithymum]
MARPSWLVDGNRIATKIRNASGDPGNAYWKSNPSRTCPKCHHIIDNSDVTQEWPGLPRGVKFDPTDQEIISHLLAKVGNDDLKPHPFIDEFIPTVDKDDGICYTHPQNLPGVKQDGSVAHLFHRAIKAYNTGTRKRRKVQGVDVGDFRWHKTGRTKPVFLDGVQRGCKKIMVLYMASVKGVKGTEKTNWVMHQYHLGAQEDEREGEYVISKVFFQQQQVVKQSERAEHESPEEPESLDAIMDPYTPKTETPEPARLERRPLSSVSVLETPNVEQVMNCTEAYTKIPSFKDINLEETSGSQPEKLEVQNENEVWDSEAYILDTQQLAEGFSLVDEFLQSQSPNRDGGENGCNEQKGTPGLSDYRHLDKETFKKDLEQCQELILDDGHIENSQDYVGIDSQAIVQDTPPDFRLSQLEFGSQDSYVAFGGTKIDSYEKGSD